MSIKAKDLQPSPFHHSGPHGVKHDPLHDFLSLFWNVNARIEADDNRPKVVLDILILILHRGDLAVVVSLFIRFPFMVLVRNSINKKVSEMLVSIDTMFELKGKQIPLSEAGKEQ